MSARGTVSVRVMHAFTISTADQNEAVHPHTTPIITGFLCGSFYRPMQQHSPIKVNYIEKEPSRTALCVRAGR
jgi:hypothetical protein